MAMTDSRVRASASATVSGIYAPQGVAGDLKDIKVQQTVAQAITGLTYGTASGQVDLVTCSQRTVNAASSATYDLYTGTDLKDLLGGTCAFRKVKYVLVTIESGGDASGVVVGGAASDEWVGFFSAAGDKLKIFPGGPAFQAGSPAGVAVGAATKNLKIENAGAAAVTVSIVVAGTSA